MKRLLRDLAVIVVCGVALGVAAALLVSCSGMRFANAADAPAPAGMTGTWSLTRDDGPTQLAAWQNWPGGSGPNNGSEIACYTRASVYAGVNLDLSLRRKPCYSDKFSADVPWQGAYLQSPWTQRYGAVEARIKVTAGKDGIADWPAFWLAGAGWPSGGEIDVMEGLGGKNCVTYHYRSAAGPAALRGGCVTITPGVFHTYGVQWAAGELRFYVDGRDVAVMSSAVIGGTPERVMLDYTTTAASPVPGVMRVAWVRAWQPAAALTAASSITGVTTMDGSPFMIARTELPLVQGKGRYQWIMCGLQVPGNETPCPGGDVAAVASWTMLKRYVLAGKWRTIMFDQEGWRYTPGWEQRQQFKYLRLAGQFAAAHHVTLIEAPVPVGYNTPAARRAGMVTVDAYAARYAPWVDIQDQSLAGDPGTYLSEATAVMRAVRKASRTAHVIDNMSTDPGGFVVGGTAVTAAQSAQIMYHSFVATRHVVSGFWFELPRWYPPTTDNCMSTGCPPVGLSFLTLLGAS